MKTNRKLTKRLKMTLYGNEGNEGNHRNADPLTL